MEISYKQSKLKLLSCNFCYGENIDFIPHFNFPVDFNNKFLEPLWWKITNTNQINEMMDSLGKIIFGEETTQQFLQRFPPSNTKLFDLILDYEGFIIYTENGKEYNKIKTEPYYISHKFKSENIPALIKISENASEIFPLSGNVKLIYDQIQNSLPQILKNINAELITGKKSFFFEGMPKKSQTSFISQPPEVQRKMLLNIGLCNDGCTFINFCYESFCKKFTMLSSSEMKKTDILVNIKQIVEKYCMGNNVDMILIRNDIANLRNKNNIHLLNFIDACINTT